jgi:hypothetical protein
MNRNILSAESFLHFLWESSSTILIVTDRSFQILDHNASFLRLLPHVQKPKTKSLLSYLSLASVADLQQTDVTAIDQITLVFTAQDGAAQSLSCRIVPAEECLIFVGEQLLLTESDVVVEMTKLNTELNNLTRELHRKNLALEKARNEIKVLHGLLPICASCKKIRDEQGHWSRLEVYIHEHSEADFSHGICPECAQKLYGEYLKNTDTLPSSS